MLDFFLETKLNPAATNVSFLDANLIKTIHYMFNECDFLSDELITEWYEKLSGQVKDAAATSKDETLEAKKHAVNKLKPFIDWLQESDEDDDDDDEDEEEDDWAQASKLFLNLWLYIFFLPFIFLFFSYRFMTFTKNDVFFFPSKLFKPKKIN